MSKMSAKKIERKLERLHSQREYFECEVGRIKLKTQLSSALKATLSGGLKESLRK